MDFPAVASVLRVCVDGEDSAWKTVAQFTKKPGKQNIAEVRVDSLMSLWEWLQMNRLVVNALGTAKVWCDGGMRCA